MKVRIYGFRASEEALTRAYADQATKLIGEHFTEYDRVDGCTMQPSTDGGAEVIVLANKEDVGSGVAEFCWRVPEPTVDQINFYKNLLS